MRILAINIPDNKPIEIALTYIFGIGRVTSRLILNQSGIALTKRTKDLTSEEINKIQNAIEKNHQVEGELRQILKSHIGRLKEIQAYRGTRHLKRLPARGQRTKTNSRTVRGNVRKTAGSGKRKVELK